MITFQEVILRLQEYWNRQGCALLQPIDLEVLRTEDLTVLETGHTSSLILLKR